MYCYGEHLIWQRAAVALARRLDAYNGFIDFDDQRCTPAEFLSEVRRSIRAHRRIVEAEVEALIIAHQDDGEYEEVWRS